MQAMYVAGLYVTSMFPACQFTQLLNCFTLLWQMLTSVEAVMVTALTSAITFLGPIPVLVEMATFSLLMDTHALVSMLVHALACCHADCSTKKQNDIEVATLEA